MTERMSFAEVVAIAHEENDRFTRKGLDVLFEIFEHLYNGGNAHNHPKWTYDEVIVLLSVCWSNLNDEILERENG